MDKQFTTWFDRFGEEATNLEEHSRIKEMLSETTEYIGGSVDSATIEQFVTSLDALTENHDFAGTGIYITALMQNACNTGAKQLKVDFHQLKKTPRHLASFLEGNPEEKPEIILYGNLYDGIAGVGAEDIVLHMAGYTGLLDAIILKPNEQYGMNDYGAAMYAKDSTIVFHDKEYSSASGFKAENCQFFAKVEPERTLEQIKGTAGKGCSFFILNDQGKAYKF